MPLNLKLQILSLYIVFGVEHLTFSIQKMCLSLYALSSTTFVAYDVIFRILCIHFFPLYLKKLVFFVVFSSYDGKTFLSNSYAFLKTIFYFVSYKNEK